MPPWNTFLTRSTSPGDCLVIFLVDSMSFFTSNLLSFCLYICRGVSYVVSSSWRCDNETPCRYTHTIRLSLYKYIPDSTRVFLSMSSSPLSVYWCVCLGRFFSGEDSSFVLREQSGKRHDLRTNDSRITRRTYLFLNI